MCELLIRVKDKTSLDPYLDTKLTKRGDVIAVQENGWGWGKEELINPDWRILVVPGLSVDQASSFLSPEVDSDPANPSKMLRRRWFKIDLDGIAVNTSWQNWIEDDTRAVPKRTLSITFAKLQALKIKKPTLLDPNILGP